MKKGALGVLMVCGGMSGFAQVPQLTVTDTTALPSTVGVGTAPTNLAVQLDFPVGLDRTLTNAFIVRDGGTMNVNGGTVGNNGAGTVTVLPGGRFFLDDSGVVNRPFTFNVEGGQYVMEFGTFQGSLRLVTDTEEGTIRANATIFDGMFTGQIVAEGAFLDVTGGVFSPGPHIFVLQSLGGGSNTTVNFAGGNLIPHTNFLSFTSLTSTFLFQGFDFQLGGQAIDPDEVVFEEGVYFLVPRSTSGETLVFSGSLADGTAFSFELPRASDSDARYGFSVVPEPHSLALLVLGAAVLAGTCRRRER